MSLRTCVHPSGRFIFGRHEPGYNVANQREDDFVMQIGNLENGKPLLNHRNFPAIDLRVENADPVYEIPNPFPFRGTTFICHSWAAATADEPESIRLPPPPEVSMSDVLARSVGPEGIDAAFRDLPEPVLLALAATSTDPEDLTRLARMSCDVVDDEAGRPLGLRYKIRLKQVSPVIHHHGLFETVVNNIHLPDPYKEVMVLLPGVQGGSEVVGDYLDEEHDCHIFEYLRSNSYIPWGHFAANMAHDAIRYRSLDLSATDMTGLRHLYYQRMYLQFAREIGMPISIRQRFLTVEELEAIRLEILDILGQCAIEKVSFTATLWGWNYGYDFSPSGYRLHASHQQIHQQYASLPRDVEAWHSGEGKAAGTIPSYACGDLVAEVCTAFRAETGQPFFDTYLAAIRANQRMDGRADLAASLIVHEDDRVLLFVPKAQTSQWELQIMTKARVGNVLEADSATRASLDHALLLGQRILASLGARMVTSIEYSKRIDAEDDDQRLLYCLMPKLPNSMGAFSEAQLRFINGHFPEDFAAACRDALTQCGAPRP